jgi:hypothetical protein
MGSSSAGCIAHVGRDVPPNLCWSHLDKVWRADMGNCPVLRVFNFLLICAPSRLSSTCAHWIPKSAIPGPVVHTVRWIRATRLHIPYADKGATFTNQNWQRSTPKRQHAPAAGDIPSGFAFPLALWQTKNCKTTPRKVAANDNTRTRHLRFQSTCGIGHSTWASHAGDTHGQSPTQTQSRKFG